MVRQDSSIQILLSILGVISLILITVGVSFAFFTYEQEVVIENNLNDGKLSLIYSENMYSNRGLSITNITPVDDMLGKQENMGKYVFDFRIVANTLSNSKLPYELTIRKDHFSVLDERVVKVYLTELSEDGETEIETELTSSLGKVKTFDVLDQTRLISANEEIEKTIYHGVVPANTREYVKKFRLRIWVSEDAPNIVQGIEELASSDHPFFQVSVNVYANAKTLSKGEVIEATSINFSDISPMVVGGTQEILASFVPVTTTNQNLVWTSSHPEIVSVSSTEDGRAILTANSVGTATIQAISQNGVCQTVDVVVTMPLP